MFRSFGAWPPSLTGTLRGCVGVGSKLGRCLDALGVGLRLRV